MTKNQKLTTLYIVRHAQTQANVRELLQGQSDSPLTKEGRIQIKNLKKELRNIHFDAFFSSDLLRARRTAEIIALERKMAVITTKALRERNFGRLEGKKYEIFSTELKHLSEKYQRLSRKEKLKFRFVNDMESDEEILMRFITFLREISVAYAGKTLLIVTHGSMIRTLLIHLGFWSYDDFIVIPNTAYVKLASDGVDFFIKGVEGVKKTPNEPKIRRRI
ncbi:MAG: histidine phosphatase family protein [Candidatus Levybacteria bacterium]|nr:histidine phosphatase family protein [Candidatus Levybacteria bacterium]